MIFFNDASLHGQFPAVEPFKESLRVLWGIRTTLIARGLQLRVCRTLRQRQVTSTATFDDFLGEVPKELKARLLLWLDREGPFWDDDRKHSEGEYFQCCEKLVTDTGVAEAACIVDDGGAGWLFSLDPSCFLHDPLSVEWLEREGGDSIVEVSNGWTEGHAEHCAGTLERPVSSWGELLEWAERCCENLMLSPQIRSQLSLQFDPVVADQSKRLLSVLNDMVGFINAGERDAFEESRVKWMHGDRARFSLSSDSEIREFGPQLTFRNPQTGNDVLCSWHGKISRLTIRIHFEWPLAEGETKLFVAYIGPKITKR